MAAIQKYVSLIIRVLVVSAIVGCTGATPFASEDTLNTMVAVTLQTMTLQAQSTPHASPTLVTSTGTLPSPTPTILMAPATITGYFGGIGQSYIRSQLGETTFSMVLPSTFDEVNNQCTATIPGSAFFML